MSKTLKCMDCVLFSFVVVMTATFSKVMWMLPFQLLFEDFYLEWLTPQGGNLSFWLMLSWFVWGASKVVPLVSRDSQAARKILHVKTWILVPFAPLIDLDAIRK